MTKDGRRSAGGGRDAPAGVPGTDTGGQPRASSGRASLAAGAAEPDEARIAGSQGRRHAFRRALAVRPHVTRAHTREQKGTTMPARTTIDAARCRELLAKGLTQTQVAARLGVSVSTVSRVARG